MKKNVLLFMLLSVCINAQINRFFYEYKYIPDINNKSDVKRDLMILDIDKKNGSYYYKDQHRQIVDSLKKDISDSDFENEIKDKITKEYGNYKSYKIDKNETKLFTIGKKDYKVIKKYPDYKTYIIEALSIDTYKVLEDQKIVWKIFPDKQKIGEYNTQKATTNFGGRQWTAWFTTEIPFQDGPYKFYGLPGLIVKIEDATASHIITLMGNKAVQGGDREEDIPDNLASVINGNEIEVTKEKFKKLSEDYNKDPSLGLKQLLNSFGSNANISTKIITNGNGTKQAEETTMNDVYKLIEKSAKENQKKDSNPIELDLVK